MPDTLGEIFKRTGAFKPDYYVPVYERLFEPMRYMQLSLLELGVLNGSSLAAWAAYFPYARIAGVDLNVPAIALDERIRMYAGSQADTGLLSRAAGEIAPDGFDIVIDDCSHIGSLAKTSFWHLFINHMKPQGLYVIEDWRTGYIPTWPDGLAYASEPDSESRMPSHDAGMVGFLQAADR
jgi:hypothetical protein